MARQQQPSRAALVHGMRAIAGGGLRDLLVKNFCVSGEVAAKPFVHVEPIPQGLRWHPVERSRRSEPWLRCAPTSPPRTILLGAIPSLPTVPTSVVPPSSRSTTTEIIPGFGEVGEIEVVAAGRCKTSSHRQRHWLQFRKKLMQQRARGAPGEDGFGRRHHCA